jgi:glyoxylase-like metal-dependent hydrolase (beta-lactamase superfamily II)
VVAHQNAKARLEQLRAPDVVIPDVGVGDRHVIELGGVRMELYFTGRNHSDNSLVMILPKDKLAFTVDFVTVETVGFRDFPDGFFPDWFESLDKVLALDWERMIGGHPFPGNRLGTKDDVRAQKQYLHDLSEAVRVAASQGKCWDAAMTEIKLPKYEKWGNYERSLPMNVEKFCNFWGRGYW